MIDHGTPAGDYHTWVRPTGPDCPRCECCTAALCEVGARLMEGCEQATSEAARALVRGCPCSSAQTEGTVAHALELWQELVRHENAREPGAHKRLHRMFVRHVLGPDTAKDPTLVGPKLRELIDESWPDQSRASG